jgi:NAD(P)-dependent dehydrogenase (short-subunit alcohol dehydrogenase family)
MRSLRELSDLCGRRAFVTGGAGHVGFAILETLVELGATVAVSDLDASQCAQRAELLNARRAGSAVPAACDLADENATRSALRQVVADCGGIEILVHCAAFVGTTDYPGWAVPFEQQTADAWRRAMEINLTSAFVLAQEAQTPLRASGNGSIILIGSIYGLIGPDMRLYADTSMANPAAYGASKGGLLQLTRYLATVLAPSVRVNAISPGGIQRNQPDVFRARYERRTPLGRMGSEEDLKGAIAYLASDLSAYVTGQHLVVDGGWTVW